MLKETKGCERLYGYSGTGWSTEKTYTGTVREARERERERGRRKELAMFMPTKV